eukprot:6492453-Amphidinium_carterae.1
MPVQLKGKATAIRLNGMSVAKPLLVSLYLDVNATREQLITTLSGLGMWLVEQQPPYILGGDWNQDPSILQQLGWAQFHDCIVRQTAEPTCNDHIRDFFLLHKLMDEKVLAVEVEGFSLSRPHSPVWLRLYGRGKTDRMLQVKRPKPMPTSKPIGPRILEPARSWQAHDTNETGIASHASTTRGNGQKLIVKGVKDVALKDWQKRWSMSTFAWWRLRNKFMSSTVALTLDEEFWYHERIGAFKCGGDMWTVPALHAAYNTNKQYWQDWVLNVIDFEWQQAIKKVLRRMGYAEIASGDRSDGYQFLKHKEVQWVEPLNELGRPVSGQDGANKVAAQWFNIWAEHPKEPSIGAVSGMPPITGQDVKAVVATAKNKAAGSDSWKVCNWKLLPEHYLDKMADLLNRWEQSADSMGVWTTDFTLLPKGRHATRPIAITVAPMRLWSRVRFKMMGKALEEKVITEAHGGTKLQCCATVAAVQALKAEAARRFGYHTGAIFIDMSKCYERVLHAKILQGAQRFGVQHWAAANCKLYQGERRIRWGLFSTGTARINGSIFPGCSNAVLWLRVMFAQLLAEAACIHPLLKVTNVVDDFSLDAMGTQREVSEQLIEGYQLLTSRLEDQNMQINHDKTGVIASSGLLSTALVRGLPGVGSAKRIHRFLGLARSSGKLRRTTLLQARCKEARRRAASTSPQMVENGRRSPEEVGRCSEG